MGSARLEVEGGEGDLIVTDPNADGRTVASAYAEGGGWWRGRTADGRVKSIFVPSSVDEPVFYVAERLT